MAIGTARFEGVVNVGTGQSVRVRDVVESLCRQMGGDLSLLAFGSKARSPGDADRLEADVELLKSVLGWVPPQRLTSTADLGRLFDHGTL
jgi:UDP-glucose 4-epimerase